MKGTIAYEFDRYCSFYYTYSVNNNNNNDDNNNNNNNNKKSVYYRVLLSENW